MNQQVEAPSTKKILVVEDNELSGRLLVSILTKAGYQAELCYQGSDAIDKIETSGVKYDLILTDLLMPQMGGFDFIGRLVKLGAVKNFMVVSCMRDKQSMDKARDLGASAYITKPFRSSDVLDRLSQFFDSGSNCAKASNF